MFCRDVIAFRNYSETQTLNKYEHTAVLSRLFLCCGQWMKMPFGFNDEASRHIAWIHFLSSSYNTLIVFELWKSYKEDLFFLQYSKISGKEGKFFSVDDHHLEGL